MTDLLYLRNGDGSHAESTHLWPNLDFSDKSKQSQEELLSKLGKLDIPQSW